MSHIPPHQLWLSPRNELSLYQLTWLLGESVVCNIFWLWAESRIHNTSFSLVVDGHGHSLYCTVVHLLLVICATSAHHPWPRFCLCNHAKNICSQFLSGCISCVVRTQFPSSGGMLLYTPLTVLNNMYRYAYDSYQICLSIHRLASPCKMLVANTVHPSRRIWTFLASVSRESR